jgi:hypothetical protein
VTTKGKIEVTHNQKSKCFVTMVNTASPSSSDTSTSITSAPPPNERRLETWEGDILSGEDAVATTTDNSTKSRSEKIYIALGNSKKVLVTLCIGLYREDKTPLIDIEKSPWSQENKSSMKPLNSDLVMEVCRRQKLFAGMEGTTSKQFSIKPKNKTREVLMEWLNTWPIRDNNCVSFLFAEAQRVEKVLQAAIDEGRENAIAIQHGAWTGPVPYLRLLHSIIDNNDTRLAFLKRCDTKTREELDAANSPNRPKSAYEIIASKWNDPDFNPVTVVSTCHVDFATSIDLSHSTVASLVPADAIGVQNRLSSIRVSLLRIIERWEQSGQGDGGRNEDEEGEVNSSSWGRLEGRSQEALDNRENFLGGNASWYLYFWEMTDKYQLLDSTLQRLSESVGAPGAGDLSVVSRARRPTEVRIDPNRSPPDGGGDSLDGSTDNLYGILRTLVTTSELDRVAARDLQVQQELATRELQIQKRCQEVRDQMDEYEEKYELTGKQFYTKVLARKTTELETLEEELQKIRESKISCKN